MLPPIIDQNHTQYPQGVYDDDQVQNAAFGRAPFNKDSVYFPTEQVHFLQDFAESKAAKQTIALLDWEKAFDEIQHDELLVALCRLGSGQHYIDIADCYRKPTFLVKDDAGTSTEKQQRSDVRLGMRLSPVLFKLRNVGHGV